MNKILNLQKLKTDDAVIYRDSAISIGCVMYSMLSITNCK